MQRKQRPLMRVCGGLCLFVILYLPPKKRRGQRQHLDNPPVRLSAIMLVCVQCCAQTAPHQSPYEAPTRVRSCRWHVSTLTMNTLSRRAAHKPNLVEQELLHATKA